MAPPYSAQGQGPRQPLPNIATLSPGTMQRGMHGESCIIYSKPKQSANRWRQPRAKLHDEVPSSLAEGQSKTAKATTTEGLICGTGRFQQQSQHWHKLSSFLRAPATLLFSFLMGPSTSFQVLRSPALLATMWPVGNMSCRTCRLAGLSAGHCSGH